MSSCQWSVLEGLQEAKEELEQEEQLLCVGLEGACCPAAPGKGSGPTSAPNSVLNRPGGLLLVAVGCKASVIPSPCPAGTIPGSGQQAGGSLGAWVTLDLSRVCDQRQDCAWGHSRGATCLRSGPAWAGGEPKGLSNPSASVGQGRGVLHFELRLRVVAVSQSPLYVKGRSSLYTRVIRAPLGLQFPLEHLLFLYVPFASHTAFLFSLQPPSFKALSRSPMSDAWECKAQDPFASSEEQDEVPHQVTVTDTDTDTGSQCQCPEEEPNGAPQKRTGTQNGMQDSGGGGMGVKKKRKKKDLGEQEGGEKASVEVKPKRRREPKEPKEPKKAKEPKKPKEPKQREVAKKPRKPREPKAPKEPKDKKSGSEPAPRTRPKKSRWVVV